MPDPTVTITKIAIHVSGESPQVLLKFEVIVAIRHEMKTPKGVVHE